MKQGRVCHALEQTRQAQVLAEVVEEDFDENTRRGRCVPIVDLDALERSPGESVSEEEMREQASHVSEHVVVVTVNRFVSLHKKVLELRLVLATDDAESLGHKTVELEVSTLLRAALYDHAADVVR